MEQQPNHLNVLFSFEGTIIEDFNEERASEWIVDVIKREGSNAAFIQIVFCNDEYLLDINQKYLNHDTFTDIITFNYNDEFDGIGGDIFISIPRIRDNAVTYRQSFEEELHRVIIHGVLHLLGYDDQDDTSRNEMRAKENYYLSLLL